MELKLNKPICLFDLETTGIDVAKDRIVEISIFKVFPNGNKEMGNKKFKVLRTNTNSISLKSDKSHHTM